MAEQRSDRLETHAPVDGLGGEGVTQLVGVDLDFASATDTSDNATDQMTFEGSAVVGNKAVVSADVVEIGGGPRAEQLDELGMERNVAIIAELADRYSKPMSVSDADDRVGFEIGKFACPHAGAGEDLDDESVPGIV